MKKKASEAGVRPSEKTLSPRCMFALIKEGVLVLGMATQDNI